MAPPDNLFIAFFCSHKMGKMFEKKRKKHISHTASKIIIVWVEHSQFVVKGFNAFDFCFKFKSAIVYTACFIRFVRTKQIFYI